MQKCQTIKPSDYWYVWETRQNTLCRYNIVYVIRSFHCFWISKSDISFVILFFCLWLLGDSVAIVKSLHKKYRPDTMSEFFQTLQKNTEERHRKDNRSWFQRKYGKPIKNSINPNMPYNPHLHHVMNNWWQRLIVLLCSGMSGYMSVYVIYLKRAFLGNYLGTIFCCITSACLLLVMLVVYNIGSLKCIWALFL